jgi:hypothetical protein
MESMVSTNQCSQFFSKLACIYLVLKVWAMPKGAGPSTAHEKWKKVRPDTTSLNSG